jgi:deoxyribonuclease-4
VTRPDELGAHMSVAGGLYRALERGVEVGCGAVQIFVKNQRQWAAPPLADEDVAAFAAARRRTRIRHVFAHGSYLVNLASPGADTWRQAVDAFTDELERAERLALSSVVIHPGSHLGLGVEGGLRRVVQALDEVTARTAGYRVRIALENTAGAGGGIGKTFGELGALLRGARRPERLGVCIDTCHLFAAGYDIRRRDGWDRVLDECRREVGFDRVLAFHLNDAKSTLGSGLDRHETIGAGALGLAPFRRLLGDRRFARVAEGAGDAERPGAADGSPEPRDAAAAPKAAHYRVDVTPTRRQSARTEQPEHFGEIGVHTFWPNVTSRSL